MNRRQLSCIVGVGLILTALAAQTAHPATLSEQRSLLSRANTMLRAVERFVAAGRPEKAVEAFSEAHAALRELSKENVDRRLDAAFARTVDAAKALHGKVSAGGLNLPAWTEIDTGKHPGKDRQGDVPRGPTTRVSFSGEIAPLLIAKCGNCHIDDRKGTFSLATYNDLARGSERAGRVITPGDGTTSLLVELITAGDMPRGGATVSPGELNRLVTWINQGAEFDGADPERPLRQLARSDPSDAMAATQAPAPEVVTATGKETVSFALDVAPILAASCFDCHGAANPRANLSFASFRRLLDGGDSGSPVVPGKPDQSLLVKKLRGAAGQRMPLNRPPLPSDQIETIAKWILEGAHFDGPDPLEDTQRVTALVRADRATRDELNQLRQEQAHRSWHLALPDESSREAETANFLVIGNLPQATLQEIGQQAEASAKSILKLLRHPSGEPWSKARITLYAFASRLDYGEFATMVERRDLRPGTQGSWGYDIVDAYGCLLAPAVSDNHVPVIQQIAAVYISERGRGRLPRWFVEGASRAVVARLVPRDSVVTGWESGIGPMAAQLRQPDDFMLGKLPPEREDIVSYGFMKALLNNVSDFNRVLESVSNGETLEEAFQQIYRRTPEELARLWLASLERRR